MCTDQDKQLRIVSLLTEQPGVLINSQDEQGHTPVFELFGSPACVKNGADFSISDKSGCTFVQYACMEDKGEGLEILLELSPGLGAATRLNKKGNTPLIEACAYRSSSCARILIRRPDTGSSFAGKDG